MGLWKRFKRAVTRFFSGGGGGGGYSSRRVVNNRDSRRVTSSNTSARRAYINAYKGERDDLNRGSSISDAWEKTRKAFKASSSSRTPEPIAQKKQQDILRERRKKETKDWYKATNHRYDVSGAKDDTEKLKRRQAVKSRAFDASTAVKEEKHELKYHPYAYSAARRGARGLSLTGELLEKKGTKGEAKKAQQYFEKNQNKIAGGIGEAAGTMAAFALTANPSKAVVKKALPKAVRVSAEKGGEKLAARLAEKKLIRKAAEKEVKNAVKKGLTKEVTKEAIDKVARQKAKETVANLGEDFAQNITTGAINDISRASANHKVGSKGWRRELAASGAMNFGLGGAATVGLPAAGKGIKRALGGVSEGAEKALAKNGKVTARELAEKAAKKATKADERISIRGLARKNQERFDKQVEDAITTEDFEAFGMPRNLARILSEDRAKQSAAKSVAPKRGISRGNIKPLAETLRGNEFIPRSRNAEWRIPPRSAERVDTSVEGLSKQLDELRGKAKQTETRDRALETKINDVEDRLNRAKWRKEGGADMDAMQKAYRGEYAGFDMSKSTNSYQSDALEGKYKDKTATVVEMSPDEYLERVYRQIFKKPSEKGGTFAALPETSENVAKYAEAMQNGEKFPLPYLDYARGQQEGRHRALAAKAAGIDRIPVVIIDDAAKPKAIIDEVAEATAKAEAATEFATSKEAIDELNSWRGETHLGSYGTITKNEDGTYNLFVNGYGDKTLTEREALDYIDDAVKRINADEERIRVTRTSPLTDAENARIKEIDDEIARLEADGKADADKHGAKGKYKGIEGYWDRQAERGRKITELTNEKSQIKIKEPAKSADDFKARQLEAILESNPKDPKLNKDATWIQSVDDIQTWDEAMRDDVYGGGDVTPDFTWDDAQKANEEGYITVYSSKPIEQGSFVTPSKMLAESYGNKTPYSERLKLDDVAWIDMSEGQVAKLGEATPSDWRESLVDANSVDEFIEANLGNKGFAEYGRSKDTSINDIRNLWYETRMKQNPMEAHEIGIEEANNIVRETLPENVRSGWFRNADSEYKPHAMYYLSGNGEARNAGLNIGYWNYKNASPNNTLSFDEWLVTPQKMYRGSHGQAAIDDDIFSAFTPDRSVAEKFATGKNASIDEITVRPIDTLGSYQTTSEQEFLVPQSVIDDAKAEASFPYEGTPEAEALVRGQQGAPLSVDEMAGVDEAMPSTNPRQTEANETIDALERRVAQIAEEPPKEADDSIKINAGEEATVGGRPSGVRQVRSAYEYNNGEPIEDGILTSWNEAWQASKEYSASHARGNKSRMSKVAVSELNAMDSDAERELRQRLADSGELNYDAISTPELYDKIAKQMRDDPDRWVKDMIDINQGGALDFRSTPEWQARVQYIMGTVDPSADEASEIAYTEAFKLAQNISSKGGQTLNLRRNFVHLTPMGKRDAILDDFVNILQRSKGFQKNHPQMRTLGHFDKRNYIRNVLMEDDAIRDGVEKLVNADDPNAVGDAFTELMYNVNKKNPKSGFDVLQELRYLNMLGNPKTHIRNIFGSAFFIPIREASNSIRSLIEKPIEKWASQYGKFDVTKHGAVWQRATPEAKNAADEAFEALKNDVLGSAKYETVSYKGRGKTAVGKAVDALSDFNSTLLTKEDDAFRTRAFKNSYAKSYSRYQRDGKPITDKIKRKIEQEAIRESQVATFNEYNSFASFLNNITRKATDAEASTGARWGGRALNAVMPFTKVPANLMNQSLNYSPLGLARGMANIKTAAKTGDSAALNTAIDQLASGMTGSAVFGLGMLLGKTTDMFTTNAGKNDPAAKFKKDRGMQNYSVTFKDPETGQGYSFTLDWLVPTSATFFSGVEMANQLKKGDFNVLDIGGDWSSVVSRLAEPVMETSMLSGLHGMLETMRGGSNTDDDKGAISILLRETVQSYMNSLVPTLAGQISRTAYKSDMQIVGDTDWEYWRNQMKSKAGLANTNILGEALGADTDAYGNVKGEKKNGADYAKSALKNFLSPANIQKVDFSKVDDEKLRVYEEAVKDGADPEEMAYLFPKKQYKKQFKVAGEEIKMSNKDVSTYNQAKTKGGEEGMRYILENIMFNRQTLNEKGDKVPADSAYTKEQKQALMNEFKGKSMREVEEWLYSQPEFKTATDAEKKKAINGLWTLDSMFDSKANASRRVGEQAVYKAQGKDVNEYNFKNEVSEKKRKALEPLVAAGVVSYEEAVDFARNAGKTYYYENEDGGQSATYYNKKEMIQYLIDKGYSYEKAEALFNAFKAPKAKPYSGNNLSSGKGRRGRRGYRRRGGGGGSSKTVKTSVPIKASDYKASKGTYKDMASALQVRSTSKRKTSTKSTAVPKITPPKVKFKKYEV